MGGGGGGGVSSGEFVTYFSVPPSMFKRSVANDKQEMLMDYD